MKENKNHWYDGLFYDIVIAPNQDKSFRLTKNIIEENSTVVDVGCGTGRFSFNFHDKVKLIDGIDLSETNINLAKRKLSKKNLSNINFFHSDVEKFFENGKHKYDYAVMSYVIHEIDEALRVNILRLLSNHVNKVILIDYLVPRPRNYWNWLNEAVEFVAGKEHYTNFKSYVKNGGIKGLAEAGGLKLISEIRNNPSTSHIVILEK